MERPLRGFRDRSVKWFFVGRWETGTGLKSSGSGVAPLDLLSSGEIVPDFYNPFLNLI